MKSLAVALTKELIRINSTNPGSYEGAIFSCIKKYLSSFPNLILSQEEVLPGRYNLMAELRTSVSSSEESALIMICHMDTVVVGEGWTFPPFEAIEQENRIYGRGACDMKSGLACCLSAFIFCAEEALKSPDTVKRTLKLICTVDEEDFMRGSEAAIRSGWITEHDWVLDAEPTNGQIQVAHKGRSWYQIDVQGHTAHASTPWKGADAIAAMAEIIHQIRLSIQSFPPHPELGSSTVTFGQIQGGYRPYVVPDHCRLWIDLRLAPPLDTEKCTELITQALQNAEKKVPGVQTSYLITGDRPYIERDPSSPLLSALQKTCLSLSYPTEIGIFPGYTDTAVIAGILHNHNCMSYGPGNLECAHQPDEYVETADILRCEQVYRNLCFSQLFHTE